MNHFDWCIAQNTKQNYDMMRQWQIIFTLSFVTKWEKNQIAKQSSKSENYPQLMKTVQSKEIGGQNQPDPQLCNQSTKPWFGARGTSSRRQGEYLYSCCVQSSRHHQLSSLKKNSMFLNYNNTNAEGSRMSMASGDCMDPEGQANHGMHTNRCQINTLKQSHPKIKTIICCYK